LADDIKALLDLVENAPKAEFNPEDVHPMFNEWFVDTQLEPGNWPSLTAWELYCNFRWWLDLRGYDLVEVPVHYFGRLLKGAGLVRGARTTKHGTDRKMYLTCHEAAIRLREWKKTYPPPAFNQESTFK
jgi:hypothetical protein